MVCHMAGGVAVVARAGAGTTGASEVEKQGVADAKATSMGFLDTAFPNVKNVSGELERGFRFWGAVSFSAFAAFQIPELMFFSCHVGCLIDDGRCQIFTRI